MDNSKQVEQLSDDIQSLVQKLDFITAEKTRTIFKLEQLDEEMAYFDNEITTLDQHEIEIKKELQWAELALNELQRDN